MSKIDGGPPFGTLTDVGDGNQIHYIDEGTGPVIVFLHGSGPGASGYSNFKQNYLVFAKAGYRVILIDLLGYGYSSKPIDQPYSLDLFYKTTSALLDQLDVSSCVLIGNSLGGAIALKMAVEDPDRYKGLIMMAPGGIEDLPIYFAMPGISKMMEAFAAGVEDMDGMRNLLELLVYNPDQVNDELVRERLAVVKIQPKEVLSTMQIPNQADRIKEIACPVLGFWGMEDQFLPVSGAQRYMTGSLQPVRFTLLNQCGHWVMLEYADVFNKACLDFLGELDHG